MGAAGAIDHSNDLNSANMFDISIVAIPYIAVLSGSYAIGKHKIGT